MPGRHITDLVGRLVGSRPGGLAIVGLMHTENLGIERVIKNTLANPHIRFLLLCGADTRQAVGHLPGQSFESLFRNGLDERGRIIGAQGKRPVLKNASREEVGAFMQQVELVPMIGEESEDVIAGQIRECAARDPGPYPYPFKVTPVERIEAPEPKRLVLDRAGYFVIYPDSRVRRLVVEHYTNQSVLDCVLEGGSPGAIYTAAIERQLLTRLDHASYLGRELAGAERSLREGTPFIQDAAPGEVAMAGSQTACGADGHATVLLLHTRKGVADGYQPGSRHERSGRQTAAPGLGRKAAADIISAAPDPAACVPPRSCALTSSVFRIRFCYLLAYRFFA